MKNSKLILATLLAAVMLLSAVYALAEGSQVPENVVVYEGEGAIIHSFLSNSVSPIIVESDKLVLIDFPGDSEEQAAAYKSYVDGLGKPIDRMIISHIDNAHWVGVEKVLPDIPLYSVDAAEIMAKDEGANLSITALEDNSQQSIDGIDYVFEVNREIGAWAIKMPTLNAVYVEHLGYVNLHVLIAPLEPRLAMLKEIESEGYSWFMPGHGSPMAAPEFIDRVEAYYGDILKAAADSATVEEAVAVIIEKYPDYNTPAMLEMMLPQFLEK